MGKFFVFFLFVLALTSCASDPTYNQRRLESSGLQQGQIVQCSGFKMWPACYATAKQICFNGFEVLSKEELLPTQTRTLRVHCK